MSLTVRADRIKTCDLDVPRVAADGRTAPPHGLVNSQPAAYVVRLLGLVVSAPRIATFEAIMNAAGDNAKFLLTTKLKDLALAAVAMGLTDITGSLTGNLAPASYSPSTEIQNIATRMTAVEQGPDTPTVNGTSSDPS